MEPQTDVDWSMGSHAARLADWDSAVQIGRRVAGPGPKVLPPDRARLREDLAAHVVHAEGLVTGFTGLTVTGFRSRAWVMGRGDWIRQNVAALQRLMEPLAQRLLEGKGNRPVIARKAVGAQVGALLGYVSRRVLGQFDVFLPPDDDGLIYFVGPNVIDVETKFALTPADFRLWVAIHEVTHRVQFSSAPWLRSYLGGIVEEYLSTVSLDSKELIDQLKRAADEARTGAGPRGVLRLLTPEQRAIFDRTQAMMSLLEGHASFVMNEVGEEHVPTLPRLKQALQTRRQVHGMEQRLQRAIGFDQKVAQYDSGERFVREVVERIGMQGFNLVWEGRENLPLPGEIGEPDRWISRVAG
ncbi:MAG TPA: zinc-dependent metalloprotease [Actinomycetota bacterium]|nr:zinc-dependent metalloprotease [Actinomycetota bacterium]